MIKYLLLSVRTVFALALLLLGSAAAPGAPALAAPASTPTFTVNSFVDVAADFTNDTSYTVCHTQPSNSTCTLRAAIMNANLNPGGAIINLPPGTYVIQIAASGLPKDDTTGDLDIMHNVTIVGAGSASTHVDGGGLSNIFTILYGATATISGLTIQNGINRQSPFVGGGIQDFGNLNLSHSVISHNTAGSGGGLYVGFGLQATLDQVTVADNSDGGIQNNGSLTVTNSSIYGNFTDFAAGGLGGGISSAGNLLLFNSTVSNNRVSGRGGGVWVFVGDATILASTIAGNLAGDGGGGAVGGGITVEGVGTTVLMANSLLADNYVGNTVSECAGTIHSRDYNYVQSIGDCNLVDSTSHNVVPGFNLLLGPLADNGGPTLTRGLWAGNPALAQIPSGFCHDPVGNAPVPDQRGVARPANANCAIGAFEGALPTPSIYSTNLVVNGDAESGAGSPNGTFVGVPDWIVTSGQLTAVPYNSPGGFPSVPTDTVPALRGYDFFAGGKGSLSTGSQTISVASIASAIDGPGVKFALAADLGGFGTDGDQAILGATFLNQAGNAIGSPAAIGPVTAADRGNHTALLHRAANGNLPPGTRSIQVNLTMTLLNGAYNDAYADNLSLVLLSPGRLFLPLLRRN